MQGGKNGAIHFQQTVEPCFAVLRHRLKAWLDDFLIYAPNEEEILRCLETFFDICREKELKRLREKISILRYEGQMVGPNTGRDWCPI